MDTKRLLTGIVVAMTLVLGWQALVGWLYKTHPEWQRPNQHAATTQPATTQTAQDPIEAAEVASAATTSVAGTQPAATRSTAGLVVASNPAAETIHLGSAAKNDPNYAMQLMLSSGGAGVQSVTLNQFRQHVGKEDRYVFQSHEEGFDSFSPLATRWLSVNGRTVALSGRTWKVVSSSADGAVFSLDIADAGGPLVRLIKEYHLPTRSDVSRGYEIKLTSRVENLSPRPALVKWAFNAPLAPPRESDIGRDRAVVSGYNDDGRVTISTHVFEEFTRDKPVRELEKSDKGLPMLWGGMSSAYFDALVLPDGAAEGKSPLEKYVAEAINPEADMELRQVRGYFQTAQWTLEPGAQVSMPLNVFFGPKQRALLNKAPYSDFPRQYSLTLITSGGCAICTFQWLIDLLVWLLRGFQFVLRDWGLAIIALVVLVRVLLHPITKRSTISMQKMGKMGPEMERLKKKYADNKEDLNKAMMQVYKEQGFTPILGCLPMFLQMPIWIALYSSLQSTFELRQEPFLRIGSLSLTWINDLSRPDRLVEFARPIPLIFGWKLHAINLLPILLAGVFYLQQKYQPKPAAATPEQAQQQKMMAWMSLIFPVFMYSMPSGLNLYIFTSTTIGIIEAKRIRDHIEARDAAEKAGKVFVEARPTRASKRIGEAGARPAKKGGLAGWLANLQKRAEEMKNDMDQKKKNDK